MRGCVERVKEDLRPLSRGHQHSAHRDTPRGNTASPTPFSVPTDGESLSNSRRIVRVRHAVKRIEMYHLLYSTAAGRVVKRAKFKILLKHTPIAAWEPAIRV
jgi:hypothetical protein